MQIGTLAWDPRDGSENIGACMLSLMPNRVRADLDAHGSTRAWRDFTSAEVDAISSVNHGIGSAQGRAGNKALPEAVKKERDEKKRVKFEATLRALREEKEEADREYQAVVDEEAAGETADADLGGPVYGAGDREPEWDAEPSDRGATMAPYFDDPHAEYDNPLFTAELGNFPRDASAFNEGSTLRDPALEYRASLDENAAGEVADTAFEGPIDGVDDQGPGFDAERSHPSPGVARYLEDSLADYENPLFTTDLGNFSFDESDFNEGSTLIEPALEEGDTTLIGDISSQEPDSLKALEKNAGIDIGTSLKELEEDTGIDFGISLKAL